MSPTALRPLRVVLPAAVLLAALAADRAPAAPDAAPPHLRWRRTYLEALLEARVRGVPVLVFRHKDECGRCDRQRKAVLENEAFVRWANERVVPFVSHNERLHDTLRIEVEGDEVEACSLYPGLTCRDHVRAAVDVDNAREEGMVKVPFQELHPNTWLVLPTDEVEQVPEEEQFTATKVRQRIEAAQKRLGDALPAKAFPPIRDLLASAEAAADEEGWQDALRALAGVHAQVPKPPASLVRLVAARLAAIDEGVRYAAEDALEAASPGAAERALVDGLLAATDVAVGGKRLPAREALQAWRSAHP